MILILIYYHDILNYIATSYLLALTCCVYVCVHMCMRVCKRACVMSVCMRMCASMHVCVCVHMHACVCVCTCVYVCMCMCVYMHVWCVCCVHYLASQLILYINFIPIGVHYVASLVQNTTNFTII